MRRISEDVTEVSFRLEIGMMINILRQPSEYYR